MKGTRAPHTRAILLIPPSSTRAVSRQIPPPESHAGMPYDSWAMVEMALACTVLPMPKDARAVNRANSTASHFQPSPRSSAYMGPPSIRPSSALTRYLIASRPSLYFVAMPNTPESQHHNTAPGPPSATAVATPTILPVPIVAAKAVAKAPNCDTSPVESLSLLMDKRMAVKSLRCGTPSLKVR